VAALIGNQTGVEPELIEGSRGEFTVWVGDRCVAQKDPNGFPTDDQILAAVHTSLTGMS
jgi:hypothetical protein